MAHVASSDVDRSPGYVNPDTRATQIAQRRAAEHRNESRRKAVRATGGCWLRPEWAADLDDHREDDA